MVKNFFAPLRAIFPKSWFCPKTPGLLRNSGTVDISTRHVMGQMYFVQLPTNPSFQIFDPFQNGGARGRFMGKSRKNGFFRFWVSFLVPYFSSPILRSNLLRIHACLA
jgi:hypothetical protein